MSSHESTEVHQRPRISHTRVCAVMLGKEAISGLLTLRLESPYHFSIPAATNGIAIFNCEAS